MKMKKNEVTPMPATQISEEMEARARLALHNLVKAGSRQVSAAEINEAVRAVLRAALFGYAVVPREPTQAMLDAGYYPAVQRRGAKSVWKCMIQAAAAAPEMEPNP